MMAKLAQVRGRRAAFLASLLLGVTGAFWASPASAGLGGSEPGLLCRMAIKQAEAGSSVPPGLLTGIARVESGRRDPVSGKLHPWPWTINAEGRGYYFDSKAEAIAFARSLQARDVRSFDVGCLQVNVMYHPSAFQSLEDAFDPVLNARYAAQFLTELRDKTGSWETASAWYHSANPELGNPYRSQVVAAMADEAKGASQYASLPTLAPGAGAGGLGGVGFASPLRSLPAGPGNVMMLSGSSSGMVLPRPAATFTGTSTASAAMGGGMVGRGLDAYRMQPVAIVGQRVFAAR